jgi:hypothetical protein
MSILDRLINSEYVIVRHNILDKSHLEFDSESKYKKILTELYSDGTWLRFENVRNGQTGNLWFNLSTHLPPSEYNELQHPLYLTPHEIEELFIPVTLIPEVVLEAGKNIVENFAFLEYPEGIPAKDVLRYAMNEFVFNMESATINNGWFLEQGKLLIENFKKYGVVASGSAFIEAGEIPEEEPSLTDNECIEIANRIFGLVTVNNVKHILKS